jgi:CARDB/Carboxypeptidase regulatory-like domain
MRMRQHIIELMVLVCAMLLFSYPALAQFSQQGPKLVATDAIGNALQGRSVAISADGNTAIVGGDADNGGAGAAWIWTRSGGVWSQGPKLVGSGAVVSTFGSGQGCGVALSADGNTAMVGGWNDTGTWVFTRSGNIWMQQGTKLVPSGVPGFGFAGQGSSVALSADGNTAIIGGPLNNAMSHGDSGAWVWTRSGGVWTQQGPILVGSGSVGDAQQGSSVSISADGNTAIIGGPADNNYVGAAWVWTRSGGVWTQQGPKLVGLGAVGGTNGGNGTAVQGSSVSISADGNTAIVGGPQDGLLPSDNTGAVWVWTRSGGVWSQQGTKLVGSGGVNAATEQGMSVSISADGNKAIVGGVSGNSHTATALVWTRSGGVWSQEGTKLVGSDAVGSGNSQPPGVSVCLSADDHTAIIGGYYDNNSAGAAWVFAANEPTISPSSHNFGGVNIGDCTSAWYFNVTNASPAPVTITSIDIQGSDTQDFYIPYDLCAGTTLSPNQTCRTWVSFWPSSQGPKQATLAVTSNGLTTTATLTGTGGLNSGNSTLAGEITTDAGAPLAGASINMGGYSTTSASDGSYNITGIVASDYTIVLSKAGYIPYQRPVSIPPATAVTQNMSLVSSGQSSAITVNSITSKYDGFLYFLAGTDFNVTFTANVDWGGHPPQTVRFITSKGTYDVVTNNDSASYSFNTATEFDPCTTLSVVAISSDGSQSAPKQADFTVMSRLTPLGALEVGDWGDGFSYHTTFGQSISLINSVLSANIPEDIPVLGGLNAALKFIPNIDATITSDGQVNVDADYLQQWTLSLPIGEVSLAPQFNLHGQYLYPGCAYDWTGSLGLSGSYEVSYPYQAFVPTPFGFPIPVVATLDVGLKGTGMGTISNIYPVDLSINNGSLVFDIHGSVGPGAVKLAEVYGWVQLGAELKFQYPQIPLLTSCQVVGQGGVGWYLYLFGSGNYTLFNVTKDFCRTNAGLSAQSTGLPVTLVPTKPTLVSRDYLSSPSSGNFLNKPKLTLNVPSLEAPQVVTSSGAIQSSVFPYAEPHLSSNGATGLSWVTDNAGRTAINRTMAVSSFWNGSSWSSPHPISDDGTADFHPWMVTFPDGSAIAAWEDEKIVQPDSALLEDMVKNLEISAARYDPATSQWTGVTRLTNNAYLDRSPQVAGPSADNAVVTWTSNQANNLVGSSSAPNILYASFYNGTTWGAPVKIAQIPYPVSSYDLTYDGTTAQVLLALDTDGDLTTITDLELYQVTVTGGVPGPLTRLTNDTVSDDSPHMTTDENGNPIVIWLRGGQLVSAPLTNIAAQTVIYTDAYSSNLAAFSLARSSSGRISITWQEPTSLNPSDLFSIFYDPTTKTWSAPRQLTSDAETESGITTAFTGQDTLMTVYNRSIIGPNPGLSDLYMVVYTLGADLALQDGSLVPSPQIPQPGQTVTFTVTALNPGDKAADNVSVAFYNGDPAASGVFLGQTAIPQALKPGDSADVSFDWTVPQGTTPTRIYAVIDPNSVFDTINRANNTVYCDILSPDLAIQTTSSQMITSTLISVTARVINKGNAPAGATTVTFRNDNAVGSVISTNNIPALGIGESVDVNIQMDISANPLSYYIIFIDVDEGNVVTELDKTNNTATITVTVDGNCTYTLGSPAATVTAAGGPYSLSITPSSPNCTWKAISNDTWITLQGNTSGTGSGTLSVAVDPNSLGAKRIGTITVAKQTFTVTEASLTHSIGLSLQGAAGTVTMVPGSACAANCAVDISAGKEVTLYPTGQCSYFTSWGGACTGQSTFCTLTMNADMQVTAAFTAYPDVWNETTQTGDASIYNVYLNASSGAVIDLQAKSYSESLVFDRSVSVTLSPGYDCDYSTASGVSTIVGLTISNGRVVLTGGTLTIQ